uniref:Uncharacterized protein n=1 Tax=Arundo donax TaxID=35708 RepID=A0A0A8ZJR0_ARUDO
MFQGYGHMDKRCRRENQLTSLASLKKN